MNPLSSFRPRFQDGTLRARCARIGGLLDGIRLDGDISLEVLSSVMTSMGMSVLNTAAWRHEVIRTLLHRPWDITVTVCWTSIYLLAALVARAAARGLRQRRAAQSGKTTAPVD